MELSQISDYKRKTEREREREVLHSCRTIPILTKNRVIPNGIGLKE